jgi:hypothetical protein
VWLGTAAQAAPAIQLTGTQLASALLPASYFPAGCKVVKSTVFNSGPRLEHGPAKYHLATFSCKNYLVNGLPETGFGETSSAGDAVNKGSQAYQQGAWQFASASQAASFFRQFYAFTTLAGTDVYAIDALGSTSPAQPAVPAALLHLIARVQAARQAITRSRWPSGVRWRPEFWLRTATARARRGRPGAVPGAVGGAAG